MKGIILHGGSGTRLRPLTYSDVKQLLTIAGKPTSEYGLKDMIEIGIKDFGIVIGKIGGAEVKNYYKNGEKWNAKIEYLMQENPLGIANAISICRNFVKDDEFVVYLGDNVIQENLKPSYKVFTEEKFDAFLVLVEVKDPSKFGVAEIEGDHIISLSEKPQNSKSNLAVTGIYFLRKSIFAHIDKLKPSSRGEFEIMEALQSLLDSGGKIGFKIIKGWFKDTGTVEDFIDCNRLVLEELNGDPKLNTDKIKGKIQFGENVKIDQNTKMLGPCYIGNNVTIEDSFIGPYTSIGDDCIIKGIDIENSVIMDNCNIRFRDGRIIYESIIGPKCKIRSGDSKTKRTKLILGRDSQVEL
jgi:glucose-1-phosphate thymidylyltransferase